MEKSGEESKPTQVQLKKIDGDRLTIEFQIEDILQKINPVEVLACMGCMGCMAIEA